MVMNPKRPVPACAPAGGPNMITGSLRAANAKLEELHALLTLFALGKVQSPLPEFVDSLRAICDHARAEVLLAASHAKMAQHLSKQLADLLVSNFGSSACACGNCGSAAANVPKPNGTG
jgi:hypothetical protein